MNLHLVLTHKWFDEMKAGRKDIEYRTMTPYWRRRIWENRHTIKTASFARGYTATIIVRLVLRIDIGGCPYDGWSEEYYRLHLEPWREGEGYD